MSRSRLTGERHTRTTSGRLDLSPGARVTALAGLGSQAYAVTISASGGGEEGVEALFGSEDVSVEVIDPQVPLSALEATVRYLATVPH